MNQVVGNPVPFRLNRRRTVLVSYVSMGEWQLFGELTKLNETSAMLQLVYHSLHRADARIKKRHIKRIARWHPSTLAPLVDFICKMSLPKMRSGSGEAAGDTERNVKIVYRLLSRMHGWSPTIISDMSPAQVYIYLTGGESGTGIQKMSGAEYQTFRAQRGMS